MSDNKRTFEVDGKEYAINRPNAALSEESNLEYTRVFSKAVKAGALLKDAILNKMREQGLWSDEKELEYLTEIRNLNELEKKLKKGGIKLSEAKSIAFDMSRKRERLQSLISQKNKLDNNSAEGQAETARFNFLLVNCLVYNNGGERVYRDVDDFLGKQSTDVAVKASETLANMWYGLSEDYEKTLPENKFLKKFEFVDDDLRLINEKGELVNEVGKRVDELGMLIDEDGNRVDYEGDPINEDGEYDFGDVVYLNEDGEPIGEEDDSNETSESDEKSESEEKPQPKKRGRPKKSASNE